MPPRRPRLARFDRFELDLDTAELRHDGAIVSLPPLPSKLLVLLVEAAPAMVDRVELRRALWGNSWLEWEAGLHQAVRRIRAALGDSAAAPRFVETIPRRGYRFIASIESTAGTSGRGLARIRSWSSTRWLATGVTSLILAAVLGLVGAGAVIDAPGDERGPTVDAEAQRLFREAAYLLRERRAEPAIERLEAAARMAPEWAEPWSALAEAHLSTPAPDRVARGRVALEAALARDDRSANAWRQLARLRLWEEWDWTGARSALERALALEPGSAETWQLLASLETVLGNGTAAVRAARRAVYLDPVSTGLQVDLGWTLYYTGQLGAAVEECERSLDLDRGNVSARQCLTQSYLALGDRLMAAKALAVDNPEQTAEVLDDYFSRRLEALEIGSTCGSSAATAVPRVALGDVDGALQSLVEGAREGHGWEVPFARVDPLFAVLSESKEFSEIRRRLGIG